ncbi:MAG: TMEM175 family protein, partial [Methanomassiliicoccales archaeon]|nr:TMEM175 family protein [Methanomassiliicoccales archaeon]
SAARPIMTTGRLEAFSDGVFAIAATLLILNVHVSGSPLGSGILHSWPSVAGYAVSFLSIGVMWINHHVVMHQIARVDRTLLLINTVFLMLVAFVPFPTQLLAEHLRGPDGRAAALLYGATLTVLAVLYNVLWFYASIGRRLLEADADPLTVRGITRSYIPGPWVYLVATLIAFASPVTSAILFAAIASFYMIESAVFAGRRRVR